MKIYLPAPNEENCSVAIDNQIAILQDALSAPLSYLTVVDYICDAAAGDTSELLTDYQVWAIRQKCQLLFCVLNISIEKIIHLIIK